MSLLFFNNVGKNLPHNQEKIRDKRATLSYPSTKVKAKSVTHLSLILRFTQNLRSFDVVFDWSIPMISPRDLATSRARSRLSSGKCLRETHVGNARLLILLKLKPGTQLCSIQVPHLDLNGDIWTLYETHHSKLLNKMKCPLPVLLQKKLDSFHLHLDLGLGPNYPKP
jgi:hypothetical protein